MVAVFSDPDCGYCKKVGASLARMDNLTVYTFLFPLETLHPQAMVKGDLDLVRIEQGQSLEPGHAARPKLVGPFTSNVRLEAGFPIGVVNENLVLGGSLPSQVHRP